MNTHDTYPSRSPENQKNKNASVDSELSRRNRIILGGVATFGAAAVIVGAKFGIFDNSLELDSEIPASSNTSTSQEAPAPVNPEDAFVVTPDKQ